MSAVADHGFKELGRAFAQVPVTEDPIADLYAMALTCRRLARANPHLYDLMFGLSTRATYRPLSDADLRLSGHSRAFREAHAHVTAACERLVHSGRVERQEPEVIAAQLWSLVHGYITLELAEHFVEFDDAVVQVLRPMGVNFSVGLGDKRERAEASHEAGRAPVPLDRPRPLRSRAVGRRPVRGLGPVRRTTFAGYQRRLIDTGEQGLVRRTAGRRRASSR